MSTTIPCKVDTQPMADKINTMSTQVKKTTAAVVSMEAAVILAEKEGADKVCKNVNRGFFTMIQSQISQKIASHYSRVEALMMQLRQQKRRLFGIKNNMTKENGRLSERYFKLFNNINKELERRIKELDRPVFDLVNKEMATTTNRMHSLAGWSGLVQKEDLAQGESLVLSHLKVDAAKAIEESSSFLRHMAYQKKLTDSIMISNPFGNESHSCEAPVAITETVSDRSGISMKKVTVCNGLSKSEAQRINDSLSRNEDLPWKNGGDLKQVEEEFMKMLESSSDSKRVKDMMRKIYQGDTPQTL